MTTFCTDVPLSAEVLMLKPVGNWSAPLRSVPPAFGVPAAVLPVVPPPGLLPLLPQAATAMAIATAGTAKRTALRPVTITLLRLLFPPGGRTPGTRRVPARRKRH